MDGPPHPSVESDQKPQEAPAKCDHVGATAGELHYSAALHCLVVLADHVPCHGQPQEKNRLVVVMASSGEPIDESQTVRTELRKTENQRKVGKAH